MNHPEILALIEAERDFTIDIRRRLHRRPSPSGKEAEAASLVEAEADRLGLPHRRYSDYGVLITLEGASSGETVLLRADMDALSMTEEPNNLIGPKVAVSEIEGLCHACGHDGHTAMLLAAMRVLTRLRHTFSGRILFLFESGEEIGGPTMPAIRALMREEQVASCFAIHLIADIELGRCCIDPGPRLMGAASIGAQLLGQGGHGSRPDRCKNPINPVAQAVTALQGLVMTCADPSESVSLSFGLMQGGTAFNIIPERASFQGSLRFLNPETGRRILEQGRTMVQALAAAHGCTVEEDYFRITIPVAVNDDRCCELARRAVAALCGPEVLISRPPRMSSETFGACLEEAPGVVMFLGTHAPERGFGMVHHNPRFDFDEAVMPTGVAAHVAYALARLGCLL
ncbi:MAG: amidohydrolase [Clostridia bacterium]|nr:amidohydrolase [Clostridia bacterium]MBQ3077891.1 amidohydrolase [Clostridia bacterium]